MKRKILFIDRDGTLIKEPPVTFQVDNINQLEFLPGVIRNLYNICRTNEYTLVMVTNQDGLGTESFPEERFWPIQNLIIRTFYSESIHFYKVHIDKSFPYENKPTRKPGVGMLTEYLNNPNFDISNSFVIGDRNTDMLLAKNLGCKGIFLKNYEEPDLENTSIAFIANSWDEIYQFLFIRERCAVEHRITKETDILVEINLDGTGQYEISTGLNFLNHMLEQFSKHSFIDLKILAKGDLHVDEHHTIEDVAITLGKTFLKAMGNKIGIERYGFVLPMDDAQATVSIDFGGRPWIVWDVKFKKEKIGDVPTEMFFHFFKSFSDNALCNIHISAYGDNEHHKIESIFKAFAKSCKMALRRNLENLQIPTTKGTF